MRGAFFGLDISGLHSGGVLFEYRVALIWEWYTRHKRDGRIYESIRLGADYKLNVAAFFL